MGLLFRHHHRTAPAQAQAAATEDTFETHFLRYLRTFDGSKCEFSEVETLFNELYDDDYYESKKDTLVTKDQVRLAHTRLFEIGSKVTLLHFKHKGADKIDIKYRVVNAEADRTIHQLIVIKNKKIIRAEDMDQRIEECPARREVCREERMMRDDPYMVMNDPYAGGIKCKVI